MRQEQLSEFVELVDYLERSPHYDLSSTRRGCVTILIKNGKDRNKEWVRLFGNMSYTDVERQVNSASKQAGYKGTSRIRQDERGNIILVYFEEISRPYIQSAKILGTELFKLPFKILWIAIQFIAGFMLLMFIWNVIRGIL